MVNENVSLVVSRLILTDIATVLTKIPDDIAKDVAHHTLEKVSSSSDFLTMNLGLTMHFYINFQVQPRVISFEEQVATIRQHLSQIYENQEQWREAAHVLTGIPLETGQK